MRSGAAGPASFDRLLLLRRAGRRAPRAADPRVKLGRFSASGSEPHSRIGRIEDDAVVDLGPGESVLEDRKSPRLTSSHQIISYAAFSLTTQPPHPPPPP